MACTEAWCERKDVVRCRSRAPADLRHDVLLQCDDPEDRHPWMHWKTWLEIDLRPA
jgi:hypothetical protein